MTALPTEARPADLPAELERHRAELTGYCYRMLGSVFEAEDAVQETMVRAWRSWTTYEGRASLRSWLYRIATNVCLDHLHGRQRRAMPMELGPASDGSRRPGGASAESLWVQPVPDGRVLGGGADPGDVTVARDSVRLAFITALQHLGPRPRAVLILRDVLAWSAAEVAELLDVTPTSVHSMLRRARRTLIDVRSTQVPTDAIPADDVVSRYVDAFERYDVEALVALLHRDATLSMPPHTLWMQGPEAIERWWRGHGATCAGNRLVATRANGTAAFGYYRPTDGRLQGVGVQVVETSAAAIVGIHVFLEPALLDLFGLPRTLG
jgi:RNA polymerase sigma-70 factor (ECF subfamily)